MGPGSGTPLHVGSALTLVTIVMNRTIVFQCSSNVNCDSIFLVTEKYLVFTFLLVKLVQKSDKIRDMECSREIMENVLLLCAHVIPFPIPVT